jgi:hypothetical protein
MNDSTIDWQPRYIHFDSDIIFWFTRFAFVRTLFNANLQTKPHSFSGKSLFHILAKNKSGMWVLPFNCPLYVVLTVYFPPWSCFHHQQSEASIFRIPLDNTTCSWFNVWSFHWNNSLLHFPSIHWSISGWLSATKQKNWWYIMFLLSYILFIL